MKFPWFWGSLFILCFFGSGATWALILSSTQADFTCLSTMRGELNGADTSHRIDTTSQTLDSTVQTTFRHLERQGWLPVQATLPFPSILTGLDPSSTIIDSHARIHLFKKGRSLLSACFIARGDRTYRWTAEMSGPPIDPRGPRHAFPFPLSPPDMTFDHFHGSWNGFEILCWSDRAAGRGPGDFRSHASSQGFDVQFHSSSKGRRIGTLRKGSIRVIAILESHPDREDVILARVPGPGKFPARRRPALDDPALDGKWGSE
jgi:hypothetical protein